MFFEDRAPLQRSRRLEEDRRAFIERTNRERWLRQQRRRENEAACVIQSAFRSWKERTAVRNRFAKEWTLCRKEICGLERDVESDRLLSILRIFVAGFPTSDSSNALEWMNDLGCLCEIVSRCFRLCESPCLGHVLGLFLAIVLRHIHVRMEFLDFLQDFFILSSTTQWALRLLQRLVERHPIIASFSEIVFSQTHSDEVRERVLELLLQAVAQGKFKGAELFFAVPNLCSTLPAPLCERLVSVSNVSTRDTLESCLSEFLEETEKGNRSSGRSDAAKWIVQSSRLNKKISNAFSILSGLASIWACEKRDQHVSVVRCRVLSRLLYFVPILDIREIDMTLFSRLSDIFAPLLVQTLFLEEGLPPNDEGWNLFPRLVHPLLTQNSTLLSTLAFSSVSTLRQPLVRCVWNSCAVRGVFSGAFMSSEDIYREWTSPSVRLSLVHVLCALSNHLFVSLVENEDDSDAERPFDDKELTMLVGVLKLICVAILPTAVSDFYVTSCVELITVLHARSARLRSFCPSESTWTVVEDPVSDTVNADLVLSQWEPFLRKVPFLIPWESRVKLWRALLGKSKSRREIWGSAAEIRIRRNRETDDAFVQFQRIANSPEKVPDGMRSNLHIVYENWHGLAEAGIDGGGLLKEMLTSLSKHAFTQYGLFLSTDTGLLYPNPSAPDLLDDWHEQYRFLGRIVGKALYEEAIIELPLAGAFLSRLVGAPVRLTDLTSIDPELYRGMSFIKKYDGNVEDLALTMSVSVDHVGVTKTIDLVPGGRDIPVTSTNRREYLYRVADSRLVQQMKRQVDAFRDGLCECVLFEWLSLFTAEELPSLISGKGDKDIDVEDLRRNTSYGQGYSSEEPTIMFFWDVVVEMTAQERRALIRFVTSMETAPLLGFEYLNPPFMVSRGALGSEVPDEMRLPSSSTCMNILKLPPYPSAEILRSKLLYAIHSEAGFELT